MAQGRRDFLRLITLAPPTVTAASARVQQNGGELNIRKGDRLRFRVHSTAAPWESTFNPHQYQVRSHGIYDSVKFPAGCDVPEWLPLYSNPIGYNRAGTWEHKTEADTNIQTAGMLPPPTKQLVERIIFLISPGADQEDLEQFCTTYFWQFQLCQKIYARGPVAQAPVFGTIADLFEDRKRKGGIVPEVCVHLEVPVEIPSLMFYSFELRGTSFRTRKPLALFTVLDGLGAFGIQ